MLVPKSLGRVCCILLACLAVPAAGCMDPQQVAKLFNNPKTKIKARWGILGGGFEITNDKEVTILGDGLRWDPVNKSIAFDHLEIRDAVSPVIDADARRWDIYGRVVMPELTTYRHMNNVDAGMLLDKAFDGAVKLASLYQPYINAKADAVRQDSLRGPLAHHVFDMLIQGFMPPKVFAQMSADDPKLQAAVAKEISDAKSILDSVPGNGVTIPPPPIKLTPAQIEAGIKAGLITDVPAKKPPPAASQKAEGEGDEGQSMEMIDSK